MLSLCVCEIIVCVCEIIVVGVRRREEEEKEKEKEPGIQNQKQEPHTKMWGKTAIYTDDIAFFLILYSVIFLIMCFSFADHEHVFF